LVAKKSQTTDKEKDRLKNSPKFCEVYSFQWNLCFILNILIYLSLLVWKCEWLVEKWFKFLSFWIPCAYDLKRLGLWLVFNYIMNMQF
jgi:hypothetical protein